MDNEIEIDRLVIDLPEDGGDANAQAIADQVMAQLARTLEEE